MSAAATAAGYLYASGRLRGRKEGEEAEKTERPQAKPRPIRVAALPGRDDPEPMTPRQPAAPAKTVRIQYRTRRWRPDAE